MIKFALVLSLVAGCSVNHRSGEYACTTTTDCASDRVCSDGYCVIPGSSNPDAPGPMKDAPKGDPDAPRPVPDAPTNTCPPGCSSCDAGSHLCKIECGKPGAADCTHAMTCPAGWNCDFVCSRQNDCKQQIDCTDGASCQFECTGAGSCRNLECGDGPCTITCSGFATCAQNISCGNSCECNVTCSGPGDATCGGQQRSVTCGVACETFDGGCTSTPDTICASTCP